MALDLRIEDFDLGGNGVEAYYFESPKIRAMAVVPQIEPARRRLWELVAHGMEYVPERVRRVLCNPGPPADGLFFFGLGGPEIVERPGADPLAIRAASEVIAAMEPAWVEAVEEARRMSDYPRVMAAWCELPLEAVLAVLETRKAAVQPERRDMLIEPTRQPTVFGRVLAEIMNERGIEDLNQLVDRADDAGQGVDGYMIGQRMQYVTDVPGGLEPLAQTLNLNFEERMRLAKAFTFEQDMASE